ncbi:MAG: hypothetical protein CMO11_01465 [Thaumarchaeota archaeon]|nr:hypothetical protein [Nitrososphaerota archaeon]|tara:strand:- start:1717 stop:2085 length:369 start_codon:yes stop_codon:yes gene_type:complete
MIKKIFAKYKKYIIFSSILIIFIILLITGLSVNNTKIIIINNYNFEPNEIEITEGVRVVWVNLDIEPHNANPENDNQEKISLIPRNAGPLQTFSYKFTEKGEYRYYCTIHPYMKGKITVYSK